MSVTDEMVTSRNIAMTGISNTNDDDRCCHGGGSEGEELHCVTGAHVKCARSSHRERDALVGLGFFRTTVLLYIG